MAELIRKGVRLHYEVIGQGIPVVLLHGLGGSINQIINTFDPREGFMFIVPDQQGHGESDVNWDTYNFDTLADDLVELADFLGIDMFYLCGISMGAAVSINLAIRYPGRIRGLMLVRNAWTIKPMENHIVDIFDECARCLAHGGLDSFKMTESYKRISQISRYTTDAFSGYFKDDASVKKYRKFQIMPRLTPMESAKDFDRIKVPTIILSNRFDLVHPFEYGAYYEKWIKDSRAFEIESKDIDPIAHRKAVNEYLSCLTNV